MERTLENRCQDHELLLGQVAAVLGEPVRALTLDWETWQIARRKWQLVRRFGLGSSEPILRLCQGNERLILELGFCHYQLPAAPVATDLLDLVQVTSTSSCDRGGPHYDFWAVRQSQFELLQKVLARESSTSTRQTSPILPAAIERQLLENTIGFLQLGVQTLAKYGVSQKRGVLLHGEPGNGKTMACRWLRWNCRKAKLAWREVTAEEFDDARGRGNAGELFQLYKPGIIQFDDFDHYFRDREQYGTGPAQTSLLAELDGLQVRRGVVYLFTTNAKLSEMDPAFRRPGRIDRFIEFTRPDAELRQRLIEGTWHADMLASLDICQIIQQTAGLSYAEMDEVKKLLVLGYLERQAWNWRAAWQMFVQGREENKTKQPIGFGRQSDQAMLAENSHMGISASQFNWQI